MPYSLNALAGMKTNDNWGFGDVDTTNPPPQRPKYPQGYNPFIPQENANTPNWLRRLVANSDGPWKDKGVYWKPSQYYKDPNYRYGWTPSAQRQQIYDKYARGDYLSPITIDVRGAKDPNRMWGEFRGMDSARARFAESGLGDDYSRESMYLQGISPFTGEQYKFLQDQLARAPQGSYLDNMGRLVVPGSKIVTDTGVYTYKGGEPLQYQPDAEGGGVPIPVGVQYEDVSNMGNWDFTPAPGVKKEGNGPFAKYTTPSGQIVDPFYATGQMVHKAWQGSMGQGGWNALIGGVINPIAAGLGAASSAGLVGQAAEKAGRSAMIANSLAAGGQFASGGGPPVLTSGLISPAVSYLTSLGIPASAAQAMLSSGMGATMAGIQGRNPLQAAAVGGLSSLAGSFGGQYGQVPGMVASRATNMGLNALMPQQAQQTQAPRLQPVNTISRYNKRVY